MTISGSSLRLQLLALLSTPAAAAAGDLDTRRAIDQLLDRPSLEAKCEALREHLRAAGAGLEQAQADRDAARVEVHTLKGRRGPQPVHAFAAHTDLRAENGRRGRALEALGWDGLSDPLAFVAGLTGARAGSAPVTCRECKDLEGKAWRRWAEIELGDDERTGAAPAQQLRRSLTQLVEDQAHALDVFAELAAAGDVDGIRMHHKHLTSAPDLSVEGAARG